jgi:hypothetical protein
MAAPATTVRATPNQVQLHEGFPIKVAFARASNICFEEIEVQPMGLMSDPINTTTCSYAAEAWADIWNKLFLQNGSVTVRYPDGTTIDFYGYLGKFEPAGQKRKEMPTAKITIVVTNWDPANKVRVNPVETRVTGT